jgi:RNA polymerase sigma-70 factor (ECF subfamily)
MPPSELEAAIARLVTEGASAHPDLPLDDADGAWTRHVEAHFAQGEAPTHAADVHLALACIAGSAAAHARLDGRLRRVTPQALTGIRLGGASAEDVLQDVRAKLLVAGKIASYAGRGPLDGWLRVTVARAALSVVRSQTAAPETDEPAALAAVAGAHDPELEALRARAAPVLERAIADALEALADEDKTLLKLHFVDGLTIDDLAAIHSLHRATMARRIARARTAVFEDARTRAIASLGGGEAEFESLVGVVLSALDVTLRRLLCIGART